MTMVFPCAIEGTLVGTQTGRVRPSIHDIQRGHYGLLWPDALDFEKHEMKAKQPKVWLVSSAHGVFNGRSIPQDDQSTRTGAVQQQNC